MRPVEARCISLSYWNKTLLPAQSFTRNLLLSRMAEEDFKLLQPHLERIALERDLELVRPEEPIAFIHFPEGGVVSIVAQIGDATIEVGVVGCEGLIGTPVLLGADRGPDRCFVQIGNANGLRMPTQALIEATARSSSLQLTMLRYVHVMGVQSARTAACNAVNELTQRLARWLLMCHDRVGDDDLILTHAFMSMMLGVRRSGVTVALHWLEGALAITTRRGVVRIRDRARLEEIAGDAYGTPEAEYRRLLGPFGKAAHPVKKLGAITH